VAVASTTEIALVNFHLSSKQRFILGRLIDDLSHAMKEIRRRTFAYPDKRGSRPRCRTGYKAFYQARLFRLT